MRRTIRRRRISAETMRELWQLWKAGERLETIGAALATPHDSVYGVIRRHGGIIPQPRRRARIALTLAEREEISRGVAAGDGVRALARRLGRAPSTISREIQRHGGRRRYR